MKKMFITLLCILLVSSFIMGCSQKKEMKEALPQDIMAESSAEKQMDIETAGTVTESQEEEYIDRLEEISDEEIDMENIEGLVDINQ